MKQRKKRIAAILATTMLLGTFTVSAASVSDIKGHWAQSTIQSWVDSGRISGYPDGTFRPEKNVTRAEMVSLINKAFNIPAGTTGSFSDVKSNYWAYAEIQKGVSYGYVSGNGNGSFRPDVSLTRAEAAVMLSKVLKLNTSQSYNEYTDNANIASWAKPYVNAVSLAGVMNGYPNGSFGPSNNLTRAEAVVAINKALTVQSNINNTANGGTTSPSTGTTTNTTQTNKEKDTNSKIEDLTVNSAKTYDGNTYDDIDVNISGATLKNVTANGDLTINSKVGNGTVTLTNVRVKGDVYVYGGGKSSIKFNNCTLDGDIISNKSGGETVALKFDNDTSLDGSVRIKDNTTISPTSSGTKIKLSKATIEDKNTTVTISSNVTISTLTLDSSATGTSLTINGTVSKFTPNAKVTVDGSGTITKLENSSKATIKGSVKVGNSISVSGVSVSPTSATVQVGKTITLNETVKPSDASNKDVSWSSSNSNVASVNKNGVVTGEKAGTATITVKTDDGSYKATCKITVTSSSSTVSVTGVSLDSKTLSLSEGDEKQLKATVSPSNASDTTVSWSSNKTDIATVNSSGKVTAVKAGTAVITVKTSSGSKTATCTVTVTKKDTPPAEIAVDSVSLDKTKLSLEAGKSETLTATVSPKNATNQSVTWSSSDDSIATVSNGKVTAVAEGSATITVTTKDGEKTATCAVTVSSVEKPEEESISLNKSSLSLTVEDTASLSATVTPKDTEVTWSSSDDSIASVTQSGEITAVSEGNATITATTKGGKTATCDITVAAKENGKDEGQEPGTDETDPKEE